VFQGIGPSKVKAKIMAAELALIDRGALETPTVQPSDVSDVCSAADFSADATESKWFYDFSKPYSEACELAPWQVENVASDMSSANTFTADDDDALAVAASEDEESWSRFIGKTPLTIIVEMQLDAQYQLLAETGDQLHPLFAMAVTIDGQMFSAAGTSKKIAKARAARNALHTLYSLEFGTAESE